LLALFAVVTTTAAQKKGIGSDECGTISNPSGNFFADRFVVIIARAGGWSSLAFVRLLLLFLLLHGN